MNQLIQYGLTERYTNEASLYPELSLGRVTAQHKGIYKVMTETGEHLAEISGKLRYETEEIAQFPTVGDFVMFSGEDDESHRIIHRILTRKSAFFRKAVGTNGQAQAVAANIDIVMICMSLNQNFNLSRLERYLSVAWDSGATPVVILTKADLCEDIPSAIAEVARIASFSDVIALSTYEDDVVDKLKPYLKVGNTLAFVGSSGVGKSTLINGLLEQEIIATKEIGIGDKGKHTTTGREMFLCHHGGVLIDTPGMRELGIESADVDMSFAEIEELAQGCKFSDCSHTTEPGCQVRKALEAGVIDQRRLDNYNKLKHEAGYDGLSSKEIENKKLERMFKDVGGKKGFRKFIKETQKKT